MTWLKGWLRALAIAHFEAMYECLDPARWGARIWGAIHLERYTTWQIWRLGLAVRRTAIAEQQEQWWDA